MLLGLLSDQSYNLKLIHVLITLLADFELIKEENTLAKERDGLQANVQELENRLHNLTEEKKQYLDRELKRTRCGQWDIFHHRIIWS